MFTAIVVTSNEAYESHTVISTDLVEGHLVDLENQGIDETDIVQSPEQDTEDAAEAWVLENYPEVSGFEEEVEEEDEEEDEDSEYDEEEEDEDEDEEEEEEEDGDGDDE